MNTIDEEITSYIHSENLRDKRDGDNKTAALLIQHLFHSRDTSFLRPAQKHHKTMEYLLSIGAVELGQWDYVLTYTWKKRMFGPISFTHIRGFHAQEMQDVDDFFDRNRIE